MYDNFSSEESRRELSEFFRELQTKAKNTFEKNKNLFGEKSKYPIDEETIKRVPYIRFAGFTKMQCQRIQTLEKMLLTISKEYNNSNEVALTYRLDGEQFSNGTERIAVAYGSEGRVELFSDDKTKKLFETSKELAIILMHNQPNNTSFSFNDLNLFYHHDEIRLFIVITNSGLVRSISRDDLFLKESAFNNLLNLLNKNIEEFSKVTMDDIVISKDNAVIAHKVMQKWLKSLDRFGLNYQEGDANNGETEKSRRQKSSSRRKEYVSRRSNRQGR